VLMGIQLPPEDQGEFHEFLSRRGYAFWDETANPAYRLFASGG